MPNTSTLLTHRLAEVLGKPSRRIIGLMSGMSMDGVDLADVSLVGDVDRRSVRLLGTSYRAYDDDLARLVRAGPRGTPGDVARLDFAVADAFARTVRDYLRDQEIAVEEIDAIGSHGQTLYHHGVTGDANNCTLQVGAPSIIAERTKILTVGNFRVRDIAAGGLGAPLVGLADHLLFADPGGAVALHNLGNVSNVTVVTPDASDMFSFDTGPANVGIDHFVRAHQLSPSGLDDDGAVSARGQVIPALLSRLLALDYFTRPIPKTAGYDEFGPAVLDHLAREVGAVKGEDLVRTAVEFTAITIRDAYERFVFPRVPTLRTVKFSGGGIYNRTLMALIRELMPRVEVEILPRELADAKEAMAFAILADRTLSGQPGSLPQLTGVSAPTVLGEIAL